LLINHPAAAGITILSVSDDDILHRILNEWVDIIPAHFETYPLIDVDAARRMPATQITSKDAATKK
jgi:hypothetical protein